VADKLRDTAGKLDEAAIDRAIGQAANRYSKIRPQVKIATLTGDGAKFLFALPGDYEPALSRLVAVEYPVDRQDPEYLDDTQDYAVDDRDRDPTTGAPRLRLIRLVLPTATTARLTYTARHVVDGISDTVPEADREACCAFAASLGCRQLASLYAQTSDPTMAAAVIAYRDRSAIYLAQAKDLEREFNEHVGVPADGYAAASVSADQDVDLGPGIGDRFYHPRVFR
jgi:hypothetical protein